MEKTSNIHPIHIKCITHFIAAIKYKCFGIYKHVQKILGDDLPVSYMVL